MAISRDDHRRQLLDYYGGIFHPDSDSSGQLKEFAATAGLNPHRLEDFHLGIGTLNEPEQERLDNLIHELDGARQQDKQEGQATAHEQALQNGDFYAQADEHLSKARSIIDRMVETGPQGPTEQQQLRNAARESIYDHGLDFDSVVQDTGVRNLHDFLNGRANLSKDEWTNLFRYCGEYEMDRNRTDIANNLYRQSKGR